MLLDPRADSDVAESEGAAASVTTCTVDLVYIDAGGGHRASALALEAAIVRAGLKWNVRLVNLREVLDPTDGFRRFTGIDPEDVYNQRIKRGWTAGLAQELKVLQAMIRWSHAALVRRLRVHWSATQPDMVVSLIPNFNRALRASLALACPQAPYVTVLTDLADHPPNFWIEKGLDQHVVCGSDRAVQQARDAGCAPSRIHATSGMILRHGFHEAQHGDESDDCDARADARRQLGLDPHRTTGIVLFGGQGAKAMLDIARRLPDRQLILACGHNAKLANALRALPAQPGQAPRLVLGFTPDPARYMRLADFFIGKPGPGSVSEAVQMKLPVIVACNRWTLPQERYNVQWVREHGVGIVVPGFAKVREAVDSLVAELPAYRSATLRMRNRAAFEVPEILRKVFSADRTA
ncbi:glycosyltransferase [Variovorax sp. RHLX14]|uniref:glycosyltransferase n=1 Tax=Variovorax sp. RHLX14 TaxID=1259731 RepID=UPI003F461C12